MNLHQDQLQRQVSNVAQWVARLALEAEVLNDQTMAEDLHEVATIMARISERGKQRRYQRVM